MLPLQVARPYEEAERPGGRGWEEDVQAGKQVVGLGREREGQAVRVKGIHEADIGRAG